MSHAQNLCDELDKFNVNALKNRITYALASLATELEPSRAAAENIGANEVAKMLAEFVVILRDMAGDFELIDDAVRRDLAAAAETDLEPGDEND